MKSNLHMTLYVQWDDESNQTKLATMSDIYFNVWLSIGTLTKGPLI